MNDDLSCLGIFELLKDAQETSLIGQVMLKDIHVAMYTGVQTVMNI